MRRECENSACKLAHGGDGYKHLTQYIKLAHEPIDMEGPTTSVQFFMDFHEHTEKEGEISESENGGGEIAEEGENSSDDDDGGVLVPR